MEEFGLRAYVRSEDVTSQSFLRAALRRQGGRSGTPAARLDCWPAGQGSAPCCAAAPPRRAPTSTAA
ncbi:unnamed protein product [Merluccius merluccius]